MRAVTPVTPGFFLELHLELHRKPAEIEALNKIVTPVTPKMKKYNYYTRYFCIIADFMR